MLRFLLLLLSIPALRAQVVVNTWPFTNATQAAWEVLSASKSAVDAVVAGCSVCEVMQCDGTVGYGGSPDENGETTLDAMVMDGTTMDVGSVGALRRVKNVVGVARAVMEHTSHTMLAGELATDFAQQMGFEVTPLWTEHSISLWQNWTQGNCQPNFRKNVVPDPSTSCGPYTPLSTSSSQPKPRPRPLLRSSSVPSSSSLVSHDTIAMLALDKQGKIAAATSTNGASHKVPGRVGDSPIVGAGAFASSEGGACGGTGDGDIMMRFAPCYQAVESMRLGMSPTQAAQDALRRILKYYPVFQGALVVLNMKGEYGAAATGWVFHYSVRDLSTDHVQVIEVPPISL